MVPEEAVQPQGSAALVYRVRPATPGQPPQAERVPVGLGVRLPGWVEVVQGLAEGDTVVVSGQQRIQRDGVPLHVVEMPKPAPALTQQAQAAIEIEAPKPGANPCAQPLHTLAGRG
jgi:membrane fusion protein (multidrug efflux system)